MNSHAHGVGGSRGMFPPHFITKICFFLGLLSFDVGCQAYSSGRDGHTHDGQIPLQLNKITEVLSVQNVSVTQGDRATLSCTVHNLGAKTVTWKRQGESHPLTIGTSPFAQDPRLSIHINQRKNEWILIIQDVKASDEGVYVCLVTTKDQNFVNTSKEVRLVVKTIQVTGTEYVEVGSLIRLKCNVTGRPNPPHEVSWFFNDVIIRPDELSGIQVTQKLVDSRHFLSFLEISTSRSSDAGDYTCKSSNGDVSTIFVNIIDDFLMSFRPSKKEPSSYYRVPSNSLATSTSCFRNIPIFRYYIIVFFILKTSMNLNLFV